MICVEVLEDLLRHIITSACIKDEKPLSAIFIANPEAGKTSLIRKYCLKTNGIFYTTDATAFGIIRDSDSLDDFLTKKYRYIVIPDLVSCLARKESTVNTFIHFMNAMIEEGIVNISTYATKIKREKRERTLALSVGLITCMTPKIFEDKRYRWNKIGFLSRVLPITYDYSFPTRLSILDYIEQQKHLKERLERLNIPKKEVDIELPTGIAKKLEPYSILLSNAHELYGFRMQKQFQTLMKSIAYLQGDSVVQEKHFEKFNELTKFINFDYTKI